jgi:GTP-binding protein
MITKKIDGVLMEPVEIAMVDVPNEYSGRVIEIFGSRKGFVEKMDQRHERTHFTFRIPAAGLVGLQSRLCPRRAARRCSTPRSKATRSGRATSPTAPRAC